MLIKIAFGLFGWYSRSGYDNIFRNQLDAIWDKLYTQSLFDFFHSFLSHIADKTDEILKRRFKALIIFFSISFLLKLLILNCFVCLFYTPYELSIKTFFYELSVFFSLEDKLHIIIFILFGVFFDLLSVSVTIFLIKIASQSLSLIKSIVLILVEIFVAITSPTWISLGLIVKSIFYPYGNNIIDLKSHPDFLFVVFRKTISSLYQFVMCGFNFQESSYFILQGIEIIVISISCIIPTLIYLFILSFLLTLKFSPKGLKKICFNSVFLITIDE